MADNRTKDTYFDFLPSFLSSSSLASGHLYNGWGTFFEVKHKNLDNWVVAILGRDPRYVGRKKHKKLEKDDDAARGECRV